MEEEKIKAWEILNLLLLALKVGNEPPAKKCGQPPEAENHPWPMTGKKMVVEFQTTKFVVICFSNNKKINIVVIIYINSYNKLVFFNI